jgi:3-oxoacyl-[acyl-carrier-protein] synthase II
MSRDVVITGLGIVSPIGVGVEQFWQSAKEGRSGIRRLSQCNGASLPPECRIAGEITDFNANDWMGGMFGRMAGRFSHFAVASSRMALTESRLNEGEIPPDRIMVAFGSSMSGLIDIQEKTFLAYLRGEKVVPWTILEFPVHAATSHATAEIGALGHTASFATGCCAGLDALGWSVEQVRKGSATAVVAGATDTPLSEYSLTAFHASGALARWNGPPATASRPFDRLRSGFVLAEGAAAVVVEDEAVARARGVHIYARVLGFASTSEGGELRTVDERGEATARAMLMAIEQAGLVPNDVDYICAHGNSMINYDAAETAGIKSAFGKSAWSLPVSSIKSMCGHALGAAGAMQVVTACLVLRDGIVPPTINYEERDDACDLDYVPNVSRRVRARTVLVHSHSIGGTHMVMVLGAPN